MIDDQPRRVDADGQRGSGAGSALAAALLGFFVITLDALVVNVALPVIGHDLGGGMTGLQWVVDGYTLMFAALLLLTTTASSLLLRPTPAATAAADQRRPRPLDHPAIDDAWTAAC